MQSRELESLIRKIDDELSVVVRRKWVFQRLAAELRVSGPAVDGEPAGFLRPIRQDIDAFPLTFVSSTPAANSKALGFRGIGYFKGSTGSPATRWSLGQHICRRRAPDDRPVVRVRIEV